MTEPYRLVVRVPFLSVAYTGRQIIAAGNMLAAYSNLVTRAGAIQNVARQPSEWSVNFHGPRGAWYAIADKTGEMVRLLDDSSQRFAALTVSLYGCVAGCMQKETCNHPNELREDARVMATDFANCLLDIAMAD